MALGCAACGQGASTSSASGDAAPAAADATAASRPAAGTAAETPTLAPAPRGQDGEFGKTPPVGGEAPAPAPAIEPEPEQPAVDDPAGEEKP